MKSDERGAALFLAIGLLAVVGTLSAVFYAGVHRQLRTHHEAEHRTEALHIAEGGVDYAIARVLRDSDYRGGDAIAVGEGRFAVELRPADAPNSFAIVSRGWPSLDMRDDRLVTIEAEVRVDGGVATIERWRRVRRSEQRD